MNKIRKEILNLITVNEKIQSALLTGEHFSGNEVALIRQCATELLEKVPPPSTTSTKVSDDGMAGEHKIQAR